MTTTDPTFDFEELLKRSTQRAHLAECDHSGLFSLSPLTSPEPSRPSSPVSSPIPINAPSIPQTSSIEPIAPVLQPVDRVKKKKAQSHACRRKNRAKEKNTRFSPYEARPTVKAKYVDDATAAHATSSMNRSATTSKGYTAIDDRIRSKKTYGLHELVGPTSRLGLALQEWDGMLSALSFLRILFLTHSLERRRRLSTPKGGWWRSWQVARQMIHGTR